MWPPRILLLRRPTRIRLAERFQEISHFRLGVFELFSKFRAAVYPPNKVQIGAKFWQNTIQPNCNFSFFDTEFFFLAKEFFKNFGERFFFQLSGVLEELRGPQRHWHVPRKKLLPVVRFFLGRLPWRRGKRLNMCWNPRLGTENDFNHLMLWCYDNMIVWWYDLRTGLFCKR